jgi:hypothetical protein
MVEAEQPISYAGLAQPAAPPGGRGDYSRIETPEAAADEGPYEQQVRTLRRPSPPPIITHVPRPIL